MSDLAKAFAGLKDVRGRSGNDEVQEQPGGRALVKAGTRPRRLTLLPAEPTAKSRHPDYTPVKVFLRKETHKAAGRKFEDAEGGDFSDLVELLLEKYLGSPGT